MLRAMIDRAAGLRSYEDEVNAVRVFFRTFSASADFHGR